MFTLFLLLAVLLVASARDFDCNQFNNDCRGCVQAASHGVSQCGFCTKDGVCHTVGSLVNPCSKDECISVCRTSSCTMDEVSYCNDVEENIGWMIGE